MNEPTLTLIGNCTNDPEIRYSAAGNAFCSWTVASTPRRFDKASNTWVDGETLFLRCTAFGESGERAGETLQRGMRVIVVGRLKQRSFETKEGDKRTVVEMDVDEVGASLRYATARVVRAERESGKPQPAQDDPWATGTAQADAPPF